jgi:hypothetical protein
MQFIVIAMLIGGALAIIILGSMRARGTAPQGDGMPFLTYFGLGFAVFTAVLSFVLPGVIIAGARSKIAKGTFGDARVVVPPDDSGKLLMVYTTALIVGAAFLEGPTFYLAIAYYLEGQILSLIAAGLLLGALAIRFPTAARVTAWIDRQLGLLEQERQGNS